MKAMLFAAGMGTRLKPLTDRMPKALVPVAGRPLLDITLSRLVEAGATEAVVNVHHFSGQIVDYIQKHSWDIPVHVSDETEALLDTGGGLRKALPLFSENESPVLLHNVDILSNADLGAFYQRSLPFDAALMVSERKTQRYLLFNDDGRLCGWTNIATDEVRSPYPDLDVTKMNRFAFSGIHCFSPRLQKLMEGRPAKFPIMDFYLSVCDKVDIRADVQPSLKLLDVGKQDTLREAEAFYYELFL